MTVVISMQAQQDPSQANISVAEAAAAASNAKHWMKMQNSGRTSGGKKTEDYTLQLILLEMTALLPRVLALHFVSSSIGYHLPAIHNLSGSGSGCSNDKCVESCKQDWEKSGDHCYIAICGVPTRRIGLPLKTSARGREATWRLSSRLPPSTLSWRE